MDSPSQIVDRFITLLTSGNLDQALELVDEDVIYDNVPVGPVHGHDGIRNIIATMEGGMDEIVFEVHRQVADGNVVLNTRTDRFRVGDRWFELPVGGWFEVTKGKITLWRDYFDLDTYMKGAAAVQTR